MQSLWRQLSDEPTRRLEAEAEAIWSRRKSDGQRFVLFVNPTKAGSYRVELVDTDGKRYKRIKIAYRPTWNDIMAVASNWATKHRVVAEDRHYCH